MGKKKEKGKKGKKEKKPPRPMTGGDKACCGFMGLLSCMWILTLMPFASWRSADANAYVGARFPSYRKMWLLGTYDNLLQRLTWTTLKRETCKLKQQYMSGTVSSMGMSIVSDATGASGSALGCGVWPVCKQHVIDRCSAYYMIWAACFGTLALIFVSMIMGFVFIGTLTFEYAQKKKKDIEAAKYNTMYVAIGVFVTAGLAMAIYVLMTMMNFDSIQKSGYYPYPGVSWAVYLGYLITFVNFVVMVYCICRARTPVEEEEAEEKDKKEAKESDAENEETANQGDGNMYPDMEPMPPGPHPGLFN